MINKIIIASNPFLDAFIQSDLLGRLIFIGLILLSITSWIVLIYKFWVTREALSSSRDFKKIFNQHKANPLSIECVPEITKIQPFHALYSILKKNTLELLNKNHHFTSQIEGGKKPYLSHADIEYVEGHLLSTTSKQIKYLENHLYILATVVSLGPFLGLLGTVWGILTTFSDMSSMNGGSTHQVVLSGLSLALATTVLGLFDAIPALIGYNYLKNSIRDFETDMERFSHDILASIEMQYRKVD